MTGKDSPKYYRVHKPITDQLIRDHLDGRITLACQQQRAGRAFTAAADLDTGGIPLLVELLQKCAERGLWAFAIAVKTDRHDGGHIFIPFANEQDTAALKQLAGEITGARELYPSKADLRLPFGLHRVALTRGFLLLQDGTQHDLDADLAAGVALLESRWQPNRGQLPPSSTNSPATSSTSTSATNSTSSPATSSTSSPRTLVRAILDHFALEDRLQHYQARKAVGQSYYCPFHEDRNPSLVVFTDPAGVTCCQCLSKSSACPLAEHPRNDVINVVAIGERISINEATRLLGAELRAARPVQASVSRRPLAAQLDQPPSSPSCPARPAAQLDQRHPPRHHPPTHKPADNELRQIALLRIMSDSTLPTCARETYKALDQAAGDQGACSLPVLTLAVRTEQDKRTVQRGLRILEQRGCLHTQQRYGLPSRYFLAWRRNDANTEGVIERSPNMLVDHDHACEGGVIGHESHDLDRPDFSAPPAVGEPASAGDVCDLDQAGELTEVGEPAQLAGDVRDLAQVGELVEVGEPAQLAGDVYEPAQLDPVSVSDSGGFWTREKLYEISRMRAGPPRPRPSTRRRREHQARFVTLAGELPKRLATAPPGALPAPAPLIIADTSDHSVIPSDKTQKPPQRGRKKLRDAPPSSAQSGFNPWSLPDDDPWIVQQRRALAGAIERGDQNRIAFYRGILESIGGTTL